MRNPFNSQVAASIFDYPANPNVNDDEFDSAVLDPAWVVGAGAFTAGVINPYASFAAGNTTYDLTVRRSWLMLQPPGSGATQRLTRAAALAGDFSVWMRASFGSRLNTVPANGDGNIGAQISTAAYDANNRADIYINESDAGAIYAKFVTVAGGVSTTVATTIDKYVTQADTQDIQLMGIQKIGTNYHGWAIGSSGSPIYLGVGAIPALVPGSLSIVTSNALSTLPGNMRMGLDYLRVVDGATFIP